MEWDNRIHKFRFLLRPLSCLYGMGVRFRNMLFDEGIWKEESFDVPVICVGNLAVGGTGKTPHIEYLIRLLKDKYRVAVVSRGYKRLTKGFVLAEMGHSYNDIGDEPFQIKHKFPKVAVAVDANRCEAIRLLMNLPKNKRPEVILLDDAFQHRYVQPSYSLLLTDYHRMYCKDSLLPAGCLREHRSGAQRADMVVVTKAPLSMKPIDYRIAEDDLYLQAHQSLFFTYIKYGELQPLFPGKAISFSKGIAYTVLAVSGIASPAPFHEELKKRAKAVRVLDFPDHHDFNEKDICRINDEFNSIRAKDKLIVMTEKDAVRLMANKGLKKEMVPYCFYLPIQIAFLQEREEEFDKIICKHIDDFYRNKKDK